MRTVRVIGVLVVLLAVAGVVVIVAPVVKGQVYVRQSGRGALTDWLSDGAHIGATVRDVDSGDAVGAVIENVDSSGPAAAAGLKAGDLVVEYDREKIRSARHLTRLIRESRAGRGVSVVVMREGKRTELTVTPKAGELRVFSFDSPEFRGSLRGLEQFGQDFGREFGRNFSYEFDGLSRLGARGRLGVSVQELTPQLADYFGVKDGVLVTTVTEATPASKAGVKAGDIITTVNAQTILNSRDLTRELSQIQGAGEVSIGVMRDRKPLTLKATLEEGFPNRRIRSLRRGAI